MEGHPLCDDMHLFTKISQAISLGMVRNGLRRYELKYHIQLLIRGKVSHRANWIQPFVKVDSKLFRLC